MAAKRSTVGMRDLLNAGLIKPGDELVQFVQATPGIKASDTGAKATVTERGTLRIGRSDYPSVSAAATAISGWQVNGWLFWKISVGGEWQPIQELRKELERSSKQTP
jgi:hypothetical protein